MGNPDRYTAYLETKNEWEAMIMKKVEGVILRSKAKWVEEGEKTINISWVLKSETITRNILRNLLIQI